MQQVHNFETTAEAYDSVQVGETDAGSEVNAGDILVIAAEGVVGVADTWPVAVTQANGALHQRDPNFSWERLAADIGVEAECFDAAIEHAQSLGFAIDGEIESQKTRIGAIDSGSDGEDLYYLFDTGACEIGRDVCATDVYREAAGGFFFNGGIGRKFCNSLTVQASPEGQTDRWLVVAHIHWDC